MDLALQRLEARQAFLGQRAGLDRLVDAAARLAVVCTVAETAAGRRRLDVLESGAQGVVRAPQLKLPDARVVDQQAAARKAEQLG